MQKTYVAQRSEKAEVKCLEEVLYFLVFTLREVAERSMSRLHVNTLKLVYTSEIHTQMFKRDQKKVCGCVVLL